MQSSDRSMAWWLLLMVCIGGVVSVDASAATLLQLRAASHPGYTRIVAQLDETAVYELRSLSEREWQIELHATRPASQVEPPRFKSSSPLAAITIETSQNQTRLRIRVREFLQPTTFTLTDPYRIVIDFRAAPTPKPAPALQTDRHAEAADQGEHQPGSDETSDGQEIGKGKLASGMPEAPTLQETGQEETLAQEEKSEPDVTASASSLSEPNEWILLGSPQLEPDSSSPTSTNGINGWVSLQWLLTLLLFIAVVLLWLQNRQLKTEIRNRQAQGDMKTAGPSESPLPDETSTVQRRRSRRSRQRRPLLRSWRVRRWISFHYRDLLFFLALLLIVVGVLVALKI